MPSNLSFSEKLTMLESISQATEVQPSQVADKFNEETESKNLQFELDLSSISNEFSGHKIRHFARQVKESFTPSIPPLLALDKVAKVNNLDSFELLRVFETRYGDINQIYQTLAEQKLQQIHQVESDANLATQTHFLQILSGIKQPSSNDNQ